MCDSPSKILGALLNAKARSESRAESPSPWDPWILSPARAVVNASKWGHYKNNKGGDTIARRNYDQKRECDKALNRAGWAVGSLMTISGTVWMVLARRYRPKAPQSYYAHTRRSPSAGWSAAPSLAGRPGP